MSLDVLNVLYHGLLKYTDMTLESMYIFLNGRSTLYEISRERNKIFAYFFHDNKDHLSGRKPLQFQLITSIVSGVKHPSPIFTPKIARYENRDKVLSKLENKFKLLNN